MGILARETLIERLCRLNDWRIADREGDLHVIRPDDGSPLRYLSVRYRDDRDFIRVWATFPVRFPPSVTETALMAALLRRNASLFFGKWSIDVVGSCEVSLSLQHTPIKDGLTPGKFRAICSELLEEREALHDLLRNAVTGVGDDAIAIIWPKRILPATDPAIATAQAAAIRRVE